MKKLLFSILLCSLSLCEAQQSGVSVRLHSCRTEFRTHYNTSAPGLSCTLELIPPPGMKMCESAMLSGEVKVKDARTIHQAERSAIVITPDNRAFTTISCTTRPTGGSIEIQGELQVTVAEERTPVNSVEVSMLEKATHDFGVASVTITPAASNSQKHNREGAMIRNADLSLTCRGGLVIRRVERVWNGINGEQYTQPTELEPTGGNTYNLHLWAAQPKETLSFVFVKAPRREKVKFSMPVQLGEIETSKR